MRSLKWLLWWIAAALLLGACSAPQSSTPTPTAAAVPEAAVIIRLSAGSIGLDREMAAQGAQRYMAAHPEVRIEIVDTPELSDERLAFYKQYLEAASSDIDIYMIDVIWPGDLARHFVDLYDYGAAQYTDEYFPATIENNTVNGHLVAMPWFVDAGVLYYRTDLFAKYEYDRPPATWDELEAMAQRIQEGERADGNTDFWGYVWQGYAYEGLTCDALEWIASNSGGTIVSPDKVITINNPKAMQALDRAAGWVGTISPPGVTGFTEEDARHVFQQGKAAFMRNWPYAYPLMNEIGSAMRARFKVAPLPAGPDGQSAATLGGWGLAVSRYSQNPQIAADVVFFLTSYEEQKIRAIEGGYNPTIMRLYQDTDVLHSTPYFSTLYDVFINAVPRPSTATAPHYAEVSRLFYNTVFDVLTQKQQNAPALQQLEQDLKALLDYRTGRP